MSKTVILSKELGVFLGSYRSHALFSSFESIGAYRAVAFKDEDDAKAFLEKHLPNTDKEFEFVQINTRKDYATCVDLIKAGYGDYTHNMIDYLPGASDTLH